MTAFIVLAVLGLHCCSGFSVAVEGSGYSRCGLRASHCCGFSCWEHGLQGTWTQAWPHAGSGAVLCGVGASQHVGSSRTGDRTRVSFIGRQILNHWTTRQVCLYYCYFLIPFVESFLALPL